VVQVNHECDSLIFAMNSRSGVTDHVGEDTRDDRPLLKEVVEVPSFWTWIANEVFWRPEVEDTQVRRVIFTLPSAFDCALVQFYVDAKGKTLTDVGWKISREVKEILKYYPSVKEVVLRGETPYLIGMTTGEFPVEVVDFMKSFKDVKTEVHGMQENSWLVRSALGRDDAEVVKHLVGEWIDWRHDLSSSSIEEHLVIDDYVDNKERNGQ
jgi:hypothetical protein